MKARTIIVTSILALGLLNRLAYGTAAEQLRPATPQASAEARNVPAQLKHIYNHKLVLTRDELPDWN